LLIRYLNARRKENAMSVYRMDVHVGDQKGLLRIEITDLPGKEFWQCNPAGIIGSHRGDVAWKGRQLALFLPGTMAEDKAGSYKVPAPGAVPLAVLDIPAIGLDSVPIGSGDAIRVATGGAGQWILTERTLKP